MKEMNTVKYITKRILHFCYVQNKNNEYWQDAGLVRYVVELELSWIETKKFIFLSV